MTDHRPATYEGLNPYEKRLFELRSIADSLDAILALLRAELDPQPEPEIIEVVEPEPQPEPNQPLSDSLGNTAPAESPAR